MRRRTAKNVCGLVPLALNPFHAGFPGKRNSARCAVLTILLLPLFLMACRSNDDDGGGAPSGTATALCEQSDYAATPYELEVPYFFPDPIIPADNPMTLEGVELGRFLFWEKALSRNNAVSCGSCHFPAAAFSDDKPFSFGLYGEPTDRNSMGIINLAWVKDFFWDGRASSLEEQILEPLVHPVEMDFTWAEAVERIGEDPEYQQRFEAAFGTACVDSVRMVKSIAQFMRTMISHRSKFDKARYYGEALLSPAENRGLELFLAEGGDPAFVDGGQGGGDCFHCHGGDLILFTDNLFRNNGLDTVFTDLGRADHTGNPWDEATFRTPTLRNIALTAPYMHDGRFATLDEVIDHYDMGGHFSATLDPLMKLQGIGLSLSPQDKADLIAFLETLTDYEFIENEAFHDPH